MISPDRFSVSAALRLFLRFSSTSSYFIQTQVNYAELGRHIERNEADNAQTWPPLPQGALFWPSAVL